MSTYIHTLTPLEIACDVTLEQVAEILPQVQLMTNARVMLPANMGPALAGSVARCALGGPAQYLGMSLNVYPVYCLNR